MFISHDTGEMYLRLDGKVSVVPVANRSGEADSWETGSEAPSEVNITMDLYVHTDTRNNGTSGFDAQRRLVTSVRKPIR